MTERSDIHKSSFVNRHSSIPALPGWALCLCSPRFKLLNIRILYLPFDWAQGGGELVEPFRISTCPQCLETGVRQI